MKNKESEQRQIIYNLIASLLIGGINFFTAPLFTRLLGPEQYGVFSVAFSWVTLFGCVMGFQTKEALSTGIYDFPEEYFLFRSSTLMLGTIISAIFFSVCLIIIKELSLFMGYSVPFVVVIIATSFSQSIFLFAQNAFSFEKKAHINLVVSVSLVSLVVVFSVLFIRLAPNESKGFGRMMGFFIPYSGYAIVCWMVLFLKKPCALDIDYWRYSLNFSFPIVFHTLSSVLLTQSDRVMMRYYEIPDSDIGIYSFYVSLAGALIMVKDALNNSWKPFYFDFLDGKSETCIKKKSKNYIELFTIIICVFLLISKEVSLLMSGKEYLRGLPVLPIIAGAVFLMFMFQFPVNCELYYKKTQRVAVCTIISAFINVILNSIFIPKTGMFGAAMATLISYLCLVLLHYCFVPSNREMESIPEIIVFLPWVLMLIICVSVFFLANDMWVIRWFIAIIMFFIEFFRILKRKSVF